MARMTAAQRRHADDTAVAAAADDERIAREFIGTYYTDRVTEARAAVAEAAAKLRQAEMVRGNWTSTGRIHPNGHLATEVMLIHLAANAPLMTAANAILNGRGSPALRQHALEASDRSHAIGRFLVAAGYKSADGRAL